MPLPVALAAGALILKAATAKTALAGPVKMVVASTKLAYAGGVAHTAFSGALIGFAWTSAALLAIGVAIEMAVNRGKMTKAEARSCAKQIEKLPGEKQLEIAAKVNDSSADIIDILHDNGIYGW
jgi:phage-related tail fiber protein